tara:strand:+ start:1031 stop:1660 length:630 start_codon:yes stop_codon:yes gene_type:complete
MSKHYFKHVPDIRYKNPLTSSPNNDNYVTIKNLFLRAKLRNDVFSDVTFLQSYTIQEGMRPDNVAEDIYGNSELDWIILVTANIINVRDEWPMSGDVLYQYCEDKYGLAINDTRHHETEEVRNSEGKLILPAGQIVDRDYTIPNPLVFNTTINPVVPISNFLAETRVNEQKRSIKVMRREYLTMFMMDMKDALEYTKSSQFINKKLKDT